MTNETTELESFDLLYLNEPEGGKQLREMRAENELLLSQQAENFCREIVLHGRLPTKAYELAFAVEEVETGRWIRPDNPGWNASRLLRTPEIIGRIKEIRDEVISWGGQIDRAEVIANLRSIAFNPDAKHSDRLTATKQLAQMEAMERQPDIQQGQALIINIPFQPNQLRTIGSGSTLDNDPQP
jgi:hypothetical protein